MPRPGVPLSPPDPHMVPSYLRRLAERYLSAERARVLSVRTPGEWEPVRKRYLRAYRASLGPFPRRTPLNARVVGRLDRPEVAIEKVVFESRPRFIVTGNLYLPLMASAQRRPAVLLLSGHHEGGKADPDSPHQVMGLALARSGVVTLAIDPLGQGERKCILDCERGESESCVTEHCLLGYPCLLTGTNLAQYFVWDAVRAVDYLVMRPEVDPGRLAVTGYSGGGTQTFSLMPLEPRLGLAAPTCFITSRLAFLGNAADAEQCLFGAIRNGLDHGALIALCAPRPYQVQATRGDFFPIEGARDSTELARHVYGALGVGDRVRIAEVDGEHGYYPSLRNAFYGWMDQWLDAGTSGAGEAERAVSPLPWGSLLCTPTGDVKTSCAGARWVGDVNRERADGIVPLKSRPADLEAVAELQATVRRAMRTVLGVRSAPVRLVGAHTAADGIETVWLRTEPGITLSATVLAPGGQAARPAALLLEDVHGLMCADARSAARREAEELRRALAAGGYVVMTLDVRGTGAGALAPPPTSVREMLLDDEAVAAQDAFMCGRSLFGMRVRDALAGMTYLRERPDVDADRLVVVGWGQGGLLALCAAALDPGVARCAAVDSLATYRMLVDAPRFAHPPSTFLWDVLRRYDLPDVAACVAPRPLLLARSVDAMQAPVPQSRLLEAYDPAVSAYRTCGAREALSVASERGAVERWLCR